MTAPATTWHTGPLERQGLHEYVHLVRHPDDPRRTPRGARKKSATAWRKDMARHSVEAWRCFLLDHLAQHGPCTFNAAMVQLMDYTADVAFRKPPDRALWQLVAEGLVEHTNHTPVLFRLAQGTPTE